MSAHVRSQLLRFARISVLAFAGQVAVVGASHLTWTTVGALAAGAVETGFRQVRPVKPLPAAAAASTAIPPG